MYHYDHFIEALKYFAPMVRNRRDDRDVAEMPAVGERWSRYESGRRRRGHRWCSSWSRGASGSRGVLAVAQDRADGRKLREQVPGAHMKTAEEGEAGTIFNSRALRNVPKRRETPRLYRRLLEVLFTYERRHVA